MSYFDPMGNKKTRRLTGQYGGMGGLLDWATGVASLPTSATGTQPAAQNTGTSMFDWLTKGYTPAVAEAVKNAPPAANAPTPSTMDKLSTFFGILSQQQIANATAQGAITAAQAQAAASARNTQLLLLGGIGVAAVAIVAMRRD